MDFEKVSRSTAKCRAVMPIVREHGSAHRRLDGRAVRFFQSLHMRVAGQRRQLRRRKSHIAGTLDLSLTSRSVWMRMPGGVGDPAPLQHRAMLSQSRCISA